MICGVCGKAIAFLFGDAEELQQELEVDLSAFIKHSKHDSNTEYVCQQCCDERKDDVLRFLVEQEVS